MKRARAQEGRESDTAGGALARRVEYGPTWRAMQTFTNERDCQHSRPDLVSRASAGVHARHERRAGASARAWRYSRRADRSRWPGDVPRAGTARGLSTARCEKSGPRRTAMVMALESAIIDLLASWNIEAVVEARSARCVCKRTQSCQHRAADPPRQQLSWPRVQCCDGSPAVPAHQSLRLSRPGSDRSALAGRERKCAGSGGWRCRRGCLHRCG